MYKLLNDQEGNAYAVLKENIWSIPFDPANTDYQAYLKWLSDGNTPLPSEEGNTPEPADSVQNS